MIRTELLQHLLADLGENASLPPLDRDPRKGGLMNREDLAKALSKVEWTTELRDGQIPSLSLDKHQGLSKLPYWKAEEYSKFMLVAPVVLRNLIPKKAYESFMLLRKIYTLVFSRRLRIQGWTEEHSKCFKKLVWAHAIRYEELYGLSACSENVEYCLHMPEDIERHSLMDNYWCYLYERLVKYYKQQSSNMKNLCKTFADRAAQLQFVNTYLTSSAAAVTSTPVTRNLQFESGSLLTAPSVESAYKVKNSVAGEQSENRDVFIFLGKPAFKVLSDQELADIRYWLRTYPYCGELPNAYSRCLATTDYDFSVVYRVGENVIVTDAEYPEREWLATITHLLVYGQHHFFLKGPSFQQHFEEIAF